MPIHWSSEEYSVVVTGRLSVDCGIIIRLWSSKDNQDNRLQSFISNVSKKHFFLDN